jgi:hypothetical protein
MVYMTTFHIFSSNKLNVEEHLVNAQKLSTSLLSMAEKL